jgi:hypothetical protein
MRDPHPVFDRNIQANAPIWRYFSFPKFVSLLQQRALYFSRANQLGDSLEGSLTQAVEVERQAWLANPPAGLSREALEQVFRNNSSIRETNTWCMYVNCWHLGEQESMAMWRGYGDGAYGVAIQSTFEKLDASVPTRALKDNPASLFIGQVKYIDHASEIDRIPEEANVYAPFICKSNAYRHEREVRAMFWDINGFTMRAYNATPVVGHFVAVDLHQLISEVVVSPLAPEWFDEVVRRTCEAFGELTRVRRSTVLRKPVF